MAAERVLVVDDDPGSARLFVRVLSESGYEVRAAADGIEVWSLLERGPVALVIVELAMPGMNGWEVIRRLRARFYEGVPPVRPDCKIIAVSARADEQTVGFVRRLGADGFLAKPVSPISLVHMVQSLLATDPGVDTRVSAALA